jgi:CrcB protein
MISTDRREYAAIFAGGAIGGGLRTWLSQVATVHVGSWPWATFSVNLVGCFLLGYFATRLQERLPMSDYRRPLLGTGLCGGLTTFSTVQLELLRMLEHGDITLALAYATVSAGLGFLALTLGTAIVRRAQLTW